jgi:uncharacterized glyoxalase superfamily protein PhnB
MAVKSIPAGYHTVTPYLVVSGAAKQIDFLKRAFQAEEVHRMARPDGAIMHAEVRIGDSFLMLGDPVGQFPATPSCLYLYVNDVDATHQRAVQAGATSVSEPADQFWGDRSGTIKDPNGNVWMIATHKEDVAPDEMERRAKAAMQKRQGA